jgi:hypothetical protein
MAGALAISDSLGPPMTAAENQYLSAESEEYVERIHRKAELHSVGVRVEAQAALNAALACLLQALAVTGDRGQFRTIVNESLNEIAEAGER